LRATGRGDAGRYGEQIARDQRIAFERDRDQLARPDRQRGGAADRFEVSQLGLGNCHPYCHPNSQNRPACERAHLLNDRALVSAE
jgi:hypothetical protein